MRNAHDPIRVLLADDDGDFRSALREWLELDARFVVVAESDTGVGLAELVSRTGTDLVVLDVRMPGGGPAAVASLSLGDSSAAHGEMPGGRSPVVVGLSAHTSAATVAAMVAAGASGFLAKGIDAGSLSDLLARCAAGEVVLAVPTGAEALRQLVRSRCADGEDWAAGSGAG